MLSRVADSIYWMSRYLERAANVARFVDVNENLMLDLPPGAPQQWPRWQAPSPGSLDNLPPGASRRWEPLVEVTGDAAAFRERYADVTPNDVFQFLAFDPENPNSILSSLRAARENARSIRESLTSAMWAEINGAYLFVEEQAAKRSVSNYEFLHRVIRAIHAVDGATGSTLSRGEAWHFSRLGRLLERADKTTRIIDVRYFMLLPSPSDIGSPLDDLHWTAVLQSASALEMYRQRHGAVHADKTANFLILDPEFPRSVRTCLRQADESLRAITGSSPGTFRNQAERRLGRLVAELDYTVIDEVLIKGLHEFLDTVQQKLNHVGEALQDSFFSPQVVSGRQPGGTASV